MKNRIIKVIVPTKEEISRLEKKFGIDVEACIVKAFVEDLHHILYPEDDFILN